MACRIAELQYKELVDISDGTRYGFIEDIEIEETTGTIKNIIVSAKKGFWGLLDKHSEIVFPWSAVKRIGPDLILIDHSGKNNAETRCINKNLY